MNATIKKIKNRIRIDFFDLNNRDSELMEEFVNSSTQFNVDQMANSPIIKNQFAGQGTIRYNGIKVCSGVTTNITFDAPFQYYKVRYRLNWKERLQVLLTGIIK